VRTDVVVVVVVGVVVVLSCVNNCATTNVHENDMPFTDKLIVSPERIVTRFERIGREFREREEGGVGGWRRFNVKV
jgi:hypothetical protein